LTGQIFQSAATTIRTAAGSDNRRHDAKAAMEQAFMAVLERRMAEEATAAGVDES